ncbi:non-specific lipid transfer protein GPI-anchored 29-like [Cryptomeria japonica]|uniref:non-specific lipid transfer protein GPI-anchored 29-like n=1 Tax=Cryptomeria japonica TaxID=3369 RepID=UPI0025AB681C|nr:non-specific lipid transfer protein GPI-anchored 29-like [Cryptomeria japonica]
MELMAKTKTLMAFMAMVALIGAADVAAQSTDCDTLMSTLAPCFGFLAGNDQCPSPLCCKAFTNIVQVNPVCYCPVLNGTAGDQLNVTKASDLIWECMVPFPGICADYDSNFSLDEAPAVPSCRTLSPLPPVPAAPFFPITPAPAPGPFFRRLLGV